MPDKYNEVFDEIIRIPWSEEFSHGPKFHNEPMVYGSPYDETIKLEADMLFVEDIPHIWDYLGYKDFWFTSNVYTYRSEEILPGHNYRYDFISNDLPNVYNGMMFFRKGDLAGEFFKMATFIMANWKETSENFLDHRRPLQMSTDVVYAMATMFLDIEDKVVDNKFKFGFVHMKNDLMGWDRNYGHKKWYHNVQSFVAEDLEIKVGHFKQVLPFHYYEKDFLTDEIIKKYERYLGI